MDEWCPLFGAIHPEWPDRARAIIIEARRILGAKPGMKASRLTPARLEEARALFAAAPKWVAYWSEARAAAVAQRDAIPGGLAFALETAPRGPGVDPQEARLGNCVIAIYLARQACPEESVDALVGAEATLTEAQAWGQRRSLASAKAAGGKGAPDKPEGHAKVIVAARDLLAKDPHRRGLAKRIARTAKGYTLRHINRILKGAGI
jgi:hypothetical protein